ncbi:MAG: hypothetical protein ACLT5U_18550 [Mediterraneibacter gnavus]
MAEWKRLAEKYKWLCILTGGIGFFLAPFCVADFSCNYFSVLKSCGTRYSGSVFYNNHTEGEEG